MSLTVERVRAALAGVNDPELGRSLVELNMIRDIVVEGDRVSFEVVLTTPACPLKNVIRSDCEKAVRAIGEPVSAIEVRFGANVRRGTASQQGQEAVAPGVRNILLVGAGKGGVGKSTVAVNLAVALAQDGARVGLMDADVYGPSIPMMMGVSGTPELDGEKRIRPLESHGIKLMSAGFLLEPGQAVIWRGPMLNSLVMQFLQQVDWGELDYLIVDLPPGTGDVQITISQHVQATGAVLVGTPQSVAMADVRRAKDMFDKVHIPVLGLVENMSLFTCDGCGKTHAIFSSGTGERVAAELGVPFLGPLPIDTRIRETGDGGEPLLVAAPASAAAEAFRTVARQLAGRVSVRAHQEAAPVIRFT